MTVSMQISKRIYEGNGETREWDVDFPLVSPADLRVYITSPEGTEEEVTSVFSFDAQTKKLIYPSEASGSAPLAGGWFLTLARQTPLTQEIDLIRQGELDAEVLETGYDKLTLAVQELNEKVGRSLQYPVSSKEHNLNAESFFTAIKTARKEMEDACERAAVLSESLEDISDDVESGVEKAKAWAVRTDSEVEAGQGYGAKKYAQDACAAALLAKGRQMGEVYFSQSALAADNPGGVPLWTGEYFANAAALYPEFYAWVQSHSALCVTKTDYDARLAEYGECPYYVADETEGSLRFPKLANYIKNAGAAGGITQSKAGLPNIMGDVLPNEEAGNTWTLKTGGCAGAFSALTNSAPSAAAVAGVEQNKPAGIRFDASLYNAVYGASSTVTPAHTTLYPWVHVYSCAAAASTAQAAQFQAALSGKADAGLENLSSAGKSAAGVLAMPSGSFVQLTLGASGSQYTAPAAGWFVFSKFSSAAGQYIQINNSSSNMILTSSFAHGSSDALAVYSPAKEGDVVKVFYNAGGNNIRNIFIYAQGEI